MKLETEAVIKELERELETRRRVYPGWIHATKISSDVAKHRIACIEKAIELLKATIPQQQQLFT